MLPGLLPPHTRNCSDIDGKRHRIEYYCKSPDDFAKTNTGLWLLPRQLSQNEAVAISGKLQELMAVPWSSELNRRVANAKQLWRIISNVEISESGCWLPDKNKTISYGKKLIDLAEIDRGTFSIDQTDDVDYLRICDCDDCINPRHYNIAFGRKNIYERKVELNPYHYQEMTDGKVRTIWGDELPSIEESLRLFRNFQLQCYPYVPASASPLTPRSISYIGFHPVTGCWEIQNYYCGVDDGVGQHLDGYGRLQFRKVTPVINSNTGEVVTQIQPSVAVAHRVIWSHFDSLHQGKVLNHLCGYRRCCNPLHLDQVTSGENNRHSHVMNKAINAYVDAHPESKDARLSLEALSAANHKLRLEYKDLFEDDRVAP